MLFFFQEVTGIYTNNFDLSLNTKNGFPVFATVIEANYVTKKHDLFSAYKLTQEDKEEIEKLAKDPRIGERVCYQANLLVYRSLIDHCEILYLEHLMNHNLFSDYQVHCTINLWPRRHKNCNCSCYVWRPREKCWREASAPWRHKCTTTGWSGHSKITIP